MGALAQHTLSKVCVWGGARRWGQNYFCTPLYLHINLEKPEYLAWKQNMLSRKRYKGMF